MLEFDVGSSQSYPAKEVEAMLSGAPATLASIALEGVATLRISPIPAELKQRSSSAQPPPQGPR